MNQRNKRELARIGIQVTAFAVALFLMFAMQAIVGGQEMPVRHVKGRANAVKTLSMEGRAPEGADVTWEIIEPVDQLFIESRNHLTIAFFVESERVVVVCDVIDWANKKRTKTKTVITPDTPSPPEPSPPPTPPHPVVPPGFAGDVYREAVKVNRKADSLRMADVFEGISARIAAGGFSTIEQIGGELTRQNDALDLDASWRPFGEWLGSQLDARATTIQASREAFEQVAIGLKAAGK